MPRRAAPGDRDRIERAMSPALRAALEELRELLDIADWRVTPLYPVFAAAACMQLAAQLKAHGFAATEALNLAADRLELERTTVDTWFRRWSEQSRPHNAEARRPSSVARLVEDAANALSA